MPRAVTESYAEIQELSDADKEELLRALMVELDAPLDANVEKAWLNEAQKRYREFAEGRVQGVPGRLVFEPLRARLG